MAGRENSRLSCSPQRWAVQLAPTAAVPEALTIWMGLSGLGVVCFLSRRKFAGAPLASFTPSRPQEHINRSGTAIDGAGGRERHHIQMAPQP